MTSIKGDDIIAETRKILGITFQERCAIYENLLRGKTLVDSDE